MRTLLILLTLVLISISVAAQEATPEPTTSGWPIVQRCVGEPTTPPEGWNHSGVIFALTYRDGLHALRADVETPYYVAFDSDSEYGISGALSPDGRWFAVPSGRIEQGNRTSNDYIVDELRVYSTEPSRDVNRIPWNTWFSGIGVSLAVREIVWLDNESFVYSYRLEGEKIVNRITGSMENYVSPFNPWLSYFAPDGTRVVSYEVSNFAEDKAGKLFNTQSGTVIQQLNSMFIYDVAWMPDSSLLITSVNSRRLPEGNTTSDIALLDRNGNIVEVMLPNFNASGYTLSNDGTFLAMNSGNKLYIINLVEQYVVDLCLEIPWNSRIAWSPESNYLAFIFPDNNRLRGDVAVLDTLSYTAYRLNYSSDSIIGWRAPADNAQSYALNCVRSHSMMLSPSEGCSWISAAPREAPGTSS